MDHQGGFLDEKTNYLDGYNKGHLDRLIGRYSVISATAEHIPGYSSGYLDGWNGRENKAEKAK